ncbi:hypothetical protein Hanom_Chr09g00791121 [Helianthus anomalus]
MIPVKILNKRKKSRFKCSDNHLNLFSCLESLYKLLHGACPTTNTLSYHLCRINV